MTSSSGPWQPAHAAVPGVSGVPGVAGQNLPGPTPARRFWAVLGTIGAVITVAFTGVAFTAIPFADTDPAGLQVWHMIGFVMALLCGGAMVWRRRAPVIVLIICATGSIVLPLDPIGPALALTWVIALKPDRTLKWAIPLAVVAIGISMGRDIARPDLMAVMAALPEDGGGPLRLTTSGYIAVTLVIIGVALAVGYLRRRALTAEGTARARGREAVRLHQELSRQEERELIAREMHDTVAHHLSLLSLHASALEVTAADPTVPDTARAMRASAHQALQEMRGLITSLRDSGDGGYGGAPPSLADLGTLVADAQRAGVVIAARIEVPQEALAPVALTRAVYRIVQESLTNALKHAPGSGVSLQVVGAPGAGLAVMVASWLRSHPIPAGNGRLPGLASGFDAFEAGGAGGLAATGSRAGVVGMTERAAALGGTLSAGPEGQLWVVRSWLPLGSR